MAQGQKGKDLKVRATGHASSSIELSGYRVWGKRTGQLCRKYLMVPGWVGCPDRY